MRRSPLRLFLIKFPPLPANEDWESYTVTLPALLSGQVGGPVNPINLQVWFGECYIKTFEELADPGRHYGYIDNAMQGAWLLLLQDVPRLSNLRRKVLDATAPCTQAGTILRGRQTFWFIQRHYQTDHCKQYGLNDLGQINISNDLSLIHI